MNKNNLTVTDPSDWLTTQVPGLKELDDSLRCHICKDFATAPMLTTCCEHTFCSLCIRRQIANTHKCPMCARPVGSENQMLKKNRELELAIEAFVGVRTQLFGLLTAPKPKKLEQRKSSQPQVEKEERSDDDIEVINEVRDPSLVPCPVCNKFFTVTEIETKHLASCLSGTGGKGPATTTFKALPKSTASKASVQPSIFTPSPSPRRQYTKLPKPGTTNIKLRDLKARIQKLGIPSHGTQTELVQREAEWITIWNANCDARRPKPKSMLLRDLDAAMCNKLIVEANGLNGGSTAASSSAAAGASKKRKYTAESARAYSKRENKTFKELAKRARASFKKGDKDTAGVNDKTGPSDSENATVSGSSSSVHKIDNSGIELERADQTKQDNRIESGFDTTVPPPSSPGVITRARTTPAATDIIDLS